ncbi:hypothetical protein K438DRAFT_1770773 [Mycena galopus ATCC 62051]|nr:hypothetical protein K438DRAFT_1770773 [Mycena galopus ATCC 62051]
MFVARFVQGNTGSEVFGFAFLALLPTAKIFGLAMEDLTLRVDPHLGRFIRVFAGNTIELISGFSEFGFGWSNAQATISLLMLGAVAAVVPSAFAGVATAVNAEKQRTAILRISRALPHVPTISALKKVYPLPPSGGKLKKRNTAADSIGPADREEEEEEHSTPAMSLPLLLITVLSEYLVGSLTNLTLGKSLTKQWVGLILIPLAGTFSRHDLIEAVKYGQKSFNGVKCGTPNIPFGLETKTIPYVESDRSLREFGSVFIWPTLKLSSGSSLAVYPLISVQAPDLLSRVDGTSSCIDCLAATPLAGSNRSGEWCSSATPTDLSGFG